MRNQTKEHSAVITIDEFQELNEENGGACIACKAWAYGVEPDARKYECEECGEHQVYGAEELLMMGLVS